jgi:hypothetical protein
MRSKSKRGALGTFPGPPWATPPPCEAPPTADTYVSHGSCRRRSTALTVSQLQPARGVRPLDYPRLYLACARDHDFNDDDLRHVHYPGAFPLRSALAFFNFRFRTEPIFCVSFLPRLISLRPIPPSVELRGRPLGDLFRHQQSATLGNHPSGPRERIFVF